MCPLTGKKQVLPDTVRFLKEGRVESSGESHLGWEMGRTPLKSTRRTGACSGGQGRLACVAGGEKQGQATRLELGQGVGRGARSQGAGEAGNKSKRGRCASRVWTRRGW